MEGMRPGRKPLGYKRVNLMLDAASIKTALVLGHGNASEGARAAFRLAAAQSLHKRKPR